MPKLQMFHYGAATVGLVALAATVVAVAGQLEWAVALLGLAIAGALAAVVLSDRRVQISSNRRANEIRDVRRTLGEVRATTKEIVRDVRATSDKVDAMQRRVVATLEAARLEAAEHHASRMDTRD